MKLWTIMTEAAYSQLATNGSLTADPNEADEDFRDAYQWMADQLSKKVGPPPASTIYPLWAWKRWSDWSDRPDLRSSDHLDSGTIGYRVEFEAEADSVLLSDYESWHNVLNKGYNAVDETEYDAFFNDLKKADIVGKPPYPEPYQSRFYKSWESIFELDWEASAWRGDPDTTPIQAVFWQLNLDQVTDVTRFMAR